MILESALWLPSISPGMWPPRMKEERKRMKAFGGRGMYEASRFLACEARGMSSMVVSWAENTLMSVVGASGGYSGAAKS